MWNKNIFLYVIKIILILWVYFFVNIENIFFINFHYSSWANNQVINSDNLSVGDLNVYIMLSLIWSGQDILPHNIEALKNFRLKFLDIPFNHFISPNYFVKEHSLSYKLLMPLIKDEDNQGVFLASWKSLLDKAQIEFKEYASFIGKKVLIAPLNINQDYGLDVAINMYNEDELDKLIDLSLFTLKKHGFVNVNSSMVSGWLADSKILEILSKTNIKYDCSAIPLHIVYSHIKNYRLVDLLKEIWSDIDIFSLPHKIRFKNTEIIEIVQNGGVIEYFSEDEILNLFKTYIKYYQMNNHDLNKYPPVLFQLVLHHTLMYESLKKLESIIQNILLISKSYKINIKFISLSDKSGYDLSAHLSSIKSKDLEVY